MEPVLLVMVGGGVGSGLRYGIGVWLAAQSATFPWATLLVNLVGSFVLGVLSTALARPEAASRHAMLLLGTGLCGGFTTMSAFSLETVHMISCGQATEAVMYTLVTMLGCGGCAAAGLLVGRFLSA